MIGSFGNKTAEDIWCKNQSKSLPREMHERAKALLTILHSVQTMDELKAAAEPPALHLHKLKGDRKEEWSITIKGAWRITFKWSGGEFKSVKIEDYH